jgi:hypothetical protein
VFQNLIINSFNLKFITIKFYVQSHSYPLITEFYDYLIYLLLVTIFIVEIFYSCIYRNIIILVVGGGDYFCVTQIAFKFINSVLQP